MSQDDTNEELENILQNARGKYQELKEEYQNFDTLREELRKSLSVVKSFATQTQNKSETVDHNAEHIQQALEKVQEKKNEIEQLVNEIQEYHQRFIDLRKKVDNEESGVDALYQNVQTIHENSHKIFKDLQSTKTEVESIKKEVEGDQGKIEDLRDESQSIKDTMEEWLEIVSNSSRYHEFNKRKRKLEIESRVWAGITIGGFLLLAYSVSQFFIIDGVSTLVVSLNKFLYITPIVALLIWSTRQYAESRLYLEKYAYKAIMSASLSSYLELYESKFGKDSQNLEKLAISTIDKIFKEPYVDKHRKQIINLLGGKVVYEDTETLKENQAEKKEDTLDARSAELNKEDNT